MKKALITGITGQDGSYLTEFLLNKGYEVHGLIRRASTFNTHRIDHLYVDPHEAEARLFLHYGDLADENAFTEILLTIKPQEIYNLGAQSHVKVSFEMPEYTGNIDALGTLRLLESIKKTGIKTKFYQASSSEMFGASPPPQNEQTPFYPRSPYAAAKVYSYWITVNYREAYDLFACNGILFNHESPRRGETFVTRKITRGLANILSGKQKKLFLGNLNARRDWGYAPEYVEAMWLMLQQDKPDDFVIGTGENHSVREFAEKAFNYAGIEIDWRGEGKYEKGVVKSIEKKWNGCLKPGDEMIEVDPRYFRPAEVENLLADISKAKEFLKWEPSVTFEDLVRIMVDYDLQQNGLSGKGEGFNIVKNGRYSWTNHEFSFYEKIRERR